MIRALSNCDIFNDLDRPLTRFSRPPHTWSRMSQKLRVMDKVTIEPLTWIITSNTAYWLLRLRLKPVAWADQQYSIDHDFQKTQLQQCTMQCQCDYNASIQVLQQYVKPSIRATLLLRTFTTTGFHSWGKPSVYHTPWRPQLQFNDVIFSLVIIRLSRSLYRTLMGSHTQYIEWYHVQWPWLTLDCDFKVVIFFDIEYLRNDER